MLSPYYVLGMIVGCVVLGSFVSALPLWSKQDTRLKQQERFICIAYISEREEKGKKWVLSF